MSARGRFLVFEGIDGCGKSTQARRVAHKLDAVLAFEPGDTPVGAALRGVVLDARVPMTPLSEVLVMAADRAQHVAEVIEPALVAGRDVVCDRFSGSTLAYQGYGRGVDLSSIRSVLDVATGGLHPDLTLLLDCPVDVAASRRDVSRADRFEGANEGFLERVRDGFCVLARAEGWAVIDATVPLDAVSAAVDTALSAVRP